MKNLLVIPSIDIKHGKTVRVVQGIPELECEQYGNDPVDMARIWRAENAKLIHIVDFDGAHDHSQRNFEVVEEICSSVVIPVEFAGGIRNYEDTVKIMQTGISRLAVNTMAVENRNELIKVLEKYGSSKICVSLDIKDEELIIRYGYFYAYYFPQNQHDLDFKTVTPVNTFRLIFKRSVPGLSW